ncbi:hypothetical protein [Amycolatopsis sp. NPDC054798]
MSAAAWTFGDLARAVNAAGAEAGQHLRYDRTSVAHWVSGTQPRGQVPALIAEALARRLGRPVTLSEIGLNGTSDSREPRYTEAAQGIPALISLTRAHLDPVRRDVLVHSIYRIEDLAVPSAPDVCQIAQQAGGFNQAGPDIPQHQANLACHAAVVFAAANHQFGSGHIRAALTAYLANDILPSLAICETDAAHRKLLAAATDLALLAGFICFDSNEHGLAQRYYRATLDLACLARDSVRYAIVLRAISQQACHLRHAALALDLALSALAAGGNLTGSHTSAFLHAQVSLCYSAVGDPAAALAHHQQAHDRLSNATGAPPPFGSYHRGELGYHAASIRTVDGDIPGAITALNSALRHYPRLERRSRALTLAALAERQLDIGLLARASATTRRFLDIYPNLCSGRVTTAMKALGERLQQFRGHPLTRGLWTDGSPFRQAGA